MPCFFEQGGGLGEYRDICTSMACKSDTSDTSYLIHTAVRGTSCGNKKVSTIKRLVYLLNVILILLYHYISGNRKTF